MKCPKCVGKLQKRTFEGIEIDSCFVCEGLWFDAGELDDVIKKDSKNFDFVGLDKKDYDGKEMAGLNHQVDMKEGGCPRCDDETILVRKKYEQKQTVNIDVCPKGHGVWLDGGEILLIRKRFLVNLKDRVDFCVNFVKYAYSLKGIKEMARSLHKKQDNNDAS